MTLIANLQKYALFVLWILYANYVFDTGMVVIVKDLKLGEVNVTCLREWKHRAINSIS